MSIYIKPANVSYGELGPLAPRCSKHKDAMLAMRHLPHQQDAKLRNQTQKLTLHVIFQQNKLAGLTLQADWLQRKKKFA